MLEKKEEQKNCDKEALGLPNTHRSANVSSSQSDNIFHKNIPIPSTQEAHV